MEISNLLGHLTHKEDLKTTFLALELTDDIVQAAVWQVVGDITEVVSIGMPIPWNGDAANLDDLVTAADTTITKACENLEKTPLEIIFGIPTTWVGADSIKSDKKAYIKKITTELELKPLGFVVVIDSLVRFLRIQEGTPPTAILIQVADTDLIISSVVLGKTHHLEIISRGDDVTKDVENGVALCVKGLEQLPSRFIVFDGMHDLDEVVQNLNLVDWASKFPFLHVPKIDALPKDVIIRALCVAGGAEVAKSIGFTINESPPEKDLPQKVVSEPDPVELVEPPSSNLEELGFSTQEVEEEVVQKQSLPKLTLPKLTPPKLSLKLPMLPKPRSFIIIPTTIILLIFLAFSTSLWLFPKATVIISVTKKIETQLLTATIDENISVADLEQSILPATTVTTQVEGSEEIATTGEKTTGDKATGEVIIYNRTPQTKLFNQGTQITSGKLSFTLDESVTVASKSAGADYVDIPGKATAKITATAIGEASNLKADTEFIIGNYTKESYIAKNDSTLSGGTSRTVKAVSSKDITSLKDSLKSKLEEQAKQELEAKGGYVAILKDSTNIENEEYSAKVGQEATTLKGTLEVSVKGYSLAEKDLVALTQAKVASILGDSYALTDSPLITLGSINASQLSFEAKVAALPIINESALANSLSGLKNPTDISAALSSVPGFNTVKAEITPSWLPPRLKSLPRKAENISIQIVPAE